MTAASEAKWRPTSEDLDVRSTPQGRDAVRTAINEEAIAAIGTLAGAGLLTLTSFDIGTVEKPIEYDSYVLVGAYLGIINKACSWWIGDWLVYGEGVYAEKFGQAVHATGLAEQTLLNRAYVCRHVAPSRRRVGVPFGVHALVAALPAREQTRWLDKAEREGWGREDLRRAMRETKATDRDESPKLPPAGEPLAPGLVLEAARAVVSAKQDYGDAWLVPKEAMARLMAAVGEED